MMICYQQWLKQSALSRHEARFLLTFYSQKSTAWLMAHGDEWVPDAILTALNLAQQRRLNGEPLAYILGNQPFYGRDFIVNPHVLIPRMETEHLIETTLALLPQDQPCCVWDLGTGSGIIAITLQLERPQWRLQGSDISKDALAVAHANCQKWQLDLPLFLADWLNPCPKQAPFQAALQDLTAIVANPPYIAHHDAHLNQGDLPFEPRLALTDNHDGLSAYRQIINQAYPRLIAGGFLLFEHGFDQATSIAELLRQAGFMNPTTCRDYANLDRVTYAQKP